MGKSLNDLGHELKKVIIDANTGVTQNFQPEKYNNLKLSMDIVKEPTPHVKISIGISEATYNINTQEKMDGSLGQNERYIDRWFNKPNVVGSLKECWKRRIDNRGKITEVQE